MARGRMMAEVPKADVVVTNPTHFAVALKYDGGLAWRRRWWWPRE
jgi:flagellar biosynthetic protein FlhB